MRDKLEKLVNRTLNFIGRVAKFSVDPYKNKTICIEELTDSSGNFLADHVWIEYNSYFEEANLEINDLIEFTAKVECYFKGSYIPAKKKKDYTLRFAKNVKKIVNGSARIIENIIQN